VELNKVYNMDCFDGLKVLEDESVDCIITSPPYFQLRRYGDDEKEIGREANVTEFIENLINVFSEARRVLKKDGTLWIVIGDTYNSTSKKSGFESKETYNDYSFRKNDRSINYKSLIGIPERLMIAMIDDGWICRNNIIWQKPNAIPESVKDRFTIDYENILFFTKSKDYYFKQIKEPMKTDDISSPRGSQGVMGTMNRGRRKQDEVGKQTYMGFNERYEAPGDLMRNKRSVWSINTRPSNIKHYAMFPTEPVEIMLEAGAKPDGVVLDMFAGAGTTLKIAKMKGYQYIGIELYKKNCDIIEKRLSSTPVVYSLDLDFEK
jgi:DNA modification methylase